MAKRSLPKKRSHLKLTRQQTAVFQRVILYGNRMITFITNPGLNLTTSQQVEAESLKSGWNKTMAELVELLM